MSPLEGPWLLLLLVMLLFALFRAVLFMRRRARREARARQGSATAAALGWEHQLADSRWYDVDVWSGSEHGVEFRMEVRVPAPGRRRGQRQVITRWNTSQLALPDGFVVLMSIPGSRGRESQSAGSGGGGLGAVVAQQTSLFFLKAYLWATFGLDGSRVVGERAPALSTWTPPALADTHSAISSDQRLAEDFLDPTVAGLLLKWLDHVAQARPGQAGVPAVLLWREGLALSFAAELRDSEEIQRIAALGAAICVMHRERHSLRTDSVPAPPAR